MPTISYQRNLDSESSTFMKAIGEAVIEAGWEQVYIDSLAIGTGTEEGPEWDASFGSSGDSAGTVTYRLPDISPVSPPWYLSIEAAWGTTAIRPFIREISLGNELRDNGAVVGTSLVVPPASITTSTFSHTLSVSEHGIFFRIGSSTQSPTMFVERLRSPDGVVLDDFLIHLRANTSFFYKVTPYFGIIQTRAIVLHAATLPGPTVASSITTQSPSLVDTSYILGPYFSGGAPFNAPPRLAVLMSVADVSEDGFIILNVDGGPKEYRVEPTSITVSGGIYAVATE